GGDVAGEVPAGGGVGGRRGVADDVTAGRRVALARLGHAGADEFFEVLVRGHGDSLSDRAAEAPRAAAVRVRSSRSAPFATSARGQESPLPPRRRPAWVPVRGSGGSAAAPPYTGAEAGP